MGIGSEVLKSVEVYGVGGAALELIIIAENERFGAVYFGLTEFQTCNGGDFVLVEETFRVVGLAAGCSVAAVSVDRLEHTAALRGHVADVAVIVDHSVGVADGARCVALFIGVP